MSNRQQNQLLDDKNIVIIPFPKKMPQLIFKNQSIYMFQASMHWMNSVYNMWKEIYFWKMNIE